MSDARIPVTLVTGYLGAGKTSLLNHLLHTTKKRYAIIVNEFGDIGIDGALIDSGSEELIELNSGCVCCVVRGDLIRTLRRLLKQDRALDGILIETTGVANPSPVIQTFYADQHLAAQCRLDAVVTVVDALHIDAQLKVSEDVAGQIALASILLLNKASEATDTGEIQTRLRALNPFAAIHSINRGQADPSLWMDTHSFDLDQVETRLLTSDETHGHITRDGITSLSLTADTPLDAGKLEQWLRDLLLVRGTDILRTKGIIDIATPCKLVLQAVQMLLEGDETTLWPQGPRQSRLVFIGRRLDPDALRAGFLACRATIPA